MTHLNAYHSIVFIEINKYVFLHVRDNFPGKCLFSLGFQLHKLRHETRAALDGFCCWKPLFSGFCVALILFSCYEVCLRYVRFSDLILRLSLCSVTSGFPLVFTSTCFCLTRVPRVSRPVFFQIWNQRKDLNISSSFLALFFFKE